MGQHASAPTRGTQATLPGDAHLSPELAISVHSSEEEDGGRIGASRTGRSKRRHQTQTPTPPLNESNHTDSIMHALNDASTVNSSFASSPLPSSVLPLVPFPLVASPRTLLQKVIATMIDGEVFIKYAYTGGVPTKTFVFFSMAPSGGGSVGSSNADTRIGGIYWNEEDQIHLSDESYPCDSSMTLHDPFYRHGARYHRTQLRCLPLISVIEVKAGGESTNSNPPPDPPTAGHHRRGTSLGHRRQKSVRHLNNHHHHHHHHHRAPSSSSHLVGFDAPALSESFKKWVNNPLVNTGDFRLVRKQRRARRAARRKAIRARLASGMTKTDDGLIDEDDDDDDDDVTSDEDLDEFDDLPTYTYVPPSPSTCLTIVTYDRTLDLVAPNSATRDLWVYGLRELVSRGDRYFNSIEPLNESQTESAISMTVTDALAQQSRENALADERYHGGTIVGRIWNHFKKTIMTTNMIGTNNTNNHNSNANTNNAAAEEALEEKDGTIQPTPPLEAGITNNNNNSNNNHNNSNLDNPTSNSTPLPISSSSTLVASQHQPSLLRSASIDNLTAPPRFDSSVTSHHARHRSASLQPTPLPPMAPSTSSSSDSNDFLSDLNRAMSCGMVGVELEIACRHLDFGRSYKRSNNANNPTTNTTIEHHPNSNNDTRVSSTHAPAPVSSSANTVDEVSDVAMGPSPVVLVYGVPKERSSKDTPFGVLIGKTERIMPTPMTTMTMSRSIDVSRASSSSTSSSSSHPSFRTRIRIDDLHRWSHLHIRVHDVARNFTSRRIGFEPSHKLIMNSELIGSIELELDTFLLRFGRESTIQLKTKHHTVPRIINFIKQWQPPPPPPSMLRQDTTTHLHSSSSTTSTTMTSYRLPFVTPEDISNMNLDSFQQRDEDGIVDGAGHTIVTDEMLEAYKSSILQRNKKVNVTSRPTHRRTITNDSTDTTEEQSTDESNGIMRKLTTPPSDEIKPSHSMLTPLLLLRVWPRLSLSAPSDAPVPVGVVGAGSSLSPVVEDSDSHLRHLRTRLTSSNNYAHTGTRRSRTRRRARSCEFGRASEWLDQLSLTVSDTTSSPLLSNLRRRRASWSCFDRASTAGVHVDKVLVPTKSPIGLTAMRGNTPRNRPARTITIPDWDVLITSNSDTESDTDADTDVSQSQPSSPSAASRSSSSIVSDSTPRSHASESEEDEYHHTGTAFERVWDDHAIELESVALLGPDQPPTGEVNSMTLIGVSDEPNLSELHPPHRHHHHRQPSHHVVPPPPPHSPFVVAPPHTSTRSRVTVSQPPRVHRRSLGATAAAAQASVIPLHAPAAAITMPPPSTPTLTPVAKCVTTPSLSSLAPADQRRLLNANSLRLLRDRMKRLQEATSQATRGQQQSQRLHMHSSTT